MKKILALLLAALMVFSLVACGPAAENNPTPTPAGGSNVGNTGNDDTPTAPKSYQFWGTYEEEGANAAMLNAAFLVDLNEDGTVVADKYSFGNFDASDADSNPTYTQSYMSGTWKGVEKDSVPCLQIKIAYVNEDGTTANDQTIYAYDVAGVYSFELNFPVVPGMSFTRVAAMEGKEGKTFATDNDFIAAYKQEFVAPEHVATMDGESCTAYLRADGTMALYFGVNPIAEGTWSLGMTGLKIAVEGQEQEIAMDGMKASFTYEWNNNGYDMSNTYSIDDITSLAGLAAAPAGGDEPQAGGDEPASEGIATYQADGLELVLLDDTHMKVKFPQYGMEREGFTYVLDGNTLTVTAPGEDELGAFSQIWSAMGAEVWTIDGDTATKAE